MRELRERASGECQGEEKVDEEEGGGRHGGEKK